MSDENNGLPWWLKVILFLALVAVVLYGLGSAFHWLP